MHLLIDNMSGLVSPEFIQQLSNHIYVYIWKELLEVSGSSININGIWFHDINQTEAHFLKLVTQAIYYQVIHKHR